MDVGSVYHVTDSVDAPSWNPFDPDFLLNPYPHYARLRDEDPVHRTPLGVLVVSRYDDAHQIPVSYTHLTLPTKA